MDLELRHRRVVCSGAYLQTVHQSTGHWWGIENVDTHPVEDRLKVIFGDDAWMVEFDSTDLSMLRCIRDWKLCVQVDPLKIYLLQVSDI